MILASGFITITHFSDPADYVLCIIGIVGCLSCSLILLGMLRDVKRIEGPRDHLPYPYLVKPKNSSEASRPDGLEGGDE